MTNRRMLLASLVLLSAYVIAGVIIPTPYVSSASSLLLLVCGTFVSARYTPVAYNVLFNNDRSSGVGEEGSHKAVYGIALIANGSVYVGLFGLLWVAMDQPATWLATWYSGLGRAIMGAGFWLLFISPDASRPQAGLPRTIWLIVIMAAALLLAFLLGQRVGSSELQTGWQGARSVVACPAGFDVIGSQNKVYHVPSSPYRPMVQVPRRCFISVAEAKRAGFRAPKTAHVVEARL